MPVASACRSSRSASVVAPLHRRVGDLEAAHLDPTGVVALDHLAVHSPVGVGDQLAARVGQLAQVAAQGVDQRTRGVVADPPVRPAELRLHEGHLVALPLHRLALDDPRATLLGRVEERLALDAAVVHQHEGDVVGRCGDVRLELVGDPFGGLGDVAEHDDGGLTEERRAGQAGDPARLEPDDGEVVDLGRGVGGARGRDHLGDGPVAEQVLGAGHEGHGRRAGSAIGGHATRRP